MKKLLNVGKVLKSILLLSFVAAVSWSPLQAQLQEPDVRAIDDPRTPFEEGFSNRIGGGVFVNNFGFGIGGTYSHALGRYSEVTFAARITGIRDVTEQNFQDFFTGQQVVPNKYNRALGFPFLFGFKQRVFPTQIADNFRFFIAASGGPAMTFIYPYIDDDDGNGYRSQRLVDSPFSQQPIPVFTERKNDIFSGLGDGTTEWGVAGEIKIGVDLGTNFKQQSTLEIGYFFYYFDQGLQIMEPSRPTGFDDQGFSTGQDPFFDAQKFFGTPQIKFTFSGWW